MGSRGVSIGRDASGSVNVTGGRSFVFPGVTELTAETIAALERGDAVEGAVPLPALTLKIEFSDLSLQTFRCSGKTEFWQTDQDGALPAEMRCQEGPVGSDQLATLGRETELRDLNLGEAHLSHELADLRQSRLAEEGSRRVR